MLDLGFLLLDRATNVFPHHACSAFSEGTRYEVLLAFSGAFGYRFKRSWENCKLEVTYSTLWAGACRTD